MEYFCSFLWVFLGQRVCVFLSDMGIESTALGLRQWKLEIIEQYITNVYQNVYIFIITI